MNYLENRSDTRWVLYLDNSSEKFYSSDLNIPTKYEQTSSGTLRTTYVLILDNRCRTAAMFMRITITKINRAGEGLIETNHKICGIIRN
ncbi:Bgt-50399 [Blumeria graminis f. sp. tritici]|uniref:Bgt-50399 n=2 Tax=Blumeria graminis TaxID=34373 RepID=A0A9X9MH71_BLUGR|nr:Bgt-50399 [Blumeria graminis f. sp. tritici]